MLERDELTRYSRHIFLNEVGLAGQERLKAARVFVVGAGGLGSPVLLYLAAAGVGHITCIDADHLELTNLQRQILYTTDDLGALKAIRAGEHLARLNPHIEYQGIPDRLTATNAAGYLRGHDLVIETSDNFETKFLVNDTCFTLKQSLVMGGILRFEGQVFCIQPGQSACYRCIFFEPPPAEAVPNCAEAGVLGAIAGVVGSLQAAQALKILSGASENPFGRLYSLDLLQGQIRSLPIERNPHCPLCAALR
ncbi:MAG: HesA/MoeB/ThiF family protein [Leptospiraceae bacterium]|nr:HesA/MoeB/ThiF family protein [Leptospiraceae bacterium]MCB1321179.1 HesA/MoeB/ThiF family protein [Leptospiraceae bacterium]